ncbi:helix-turn-helix domain-containing protein [Nocardioides taihuensis]|uniref:Helix-turn-helix domain-containing protein n=1 Tax=Nocardioides taihuensis TaxID=1835606 RepID=A0ABW0BS03_9ACTN
MANIDVRWSLPFIRTDGSGRQPETETITVPQVVAYNIARARKARNLSQLDLAGRLAWVSGKLWSVALVSAAEAGWAGRTGRVRSFSVDDLVSFGLALEVPVAWLLLPPATTPSGEPAPESAAWITMRPGEEVTKLLDREVMAWLALTRVDPEDDDNLLGRRLGEEFREFASREPGEEERRIVKKIKDLLGELDALVEGHQS